MRVCVYTYVSIHPFNNSTEERTKKKGESAFNRATREYKSSSEEDERDKESNAQLVLYPSKEGPAALDTG